MLANGKPKRQILRDFLMDFGAKMGPKYAQMSNLDLCLTLVDDDDDHHDDDNEDDKDDDASLSIWPSGMREAIKFAVPHRGAGVI